MEFIEHHNIKVHILQNENSFCMHDDGRILLANPCLKKSLLHRQDMPLGKKEIRKVEKRIHWYAIHPFSHLINMTWQSFMGWRLFSTAILFDFQKGQLCCISCGSELFRIKFRIAWRLTGESTMRSVSKRAFPKVIFPFSSGFLCIHHFFKKHFKYSSYTSLNKACHCSPWPAVKTQRQIYSQR